MSVFKGQTGEVSCLRISPDGHYFFSLEGYETVRIWSLDSGQCSGIFFLRGLFTFCFDWIRRRMIAGFSNGTVQFFVLENLDFGPFVTTVSQESLSEDLPPGPSFARPPCCGQRIPIPADAVERIELWSNSGGNGGYSDPDLLIDCPACGTLLRLNPFLLSISAS